jgi:hypothetical protein
LENDRRLATLRKIEAKNARLEALRQEKELLLQERLTIRQSLDAKKSQIRSEFDHRKRMLSYSGSLSAGNSMSSTRGFGFGSPGTTMRQSTKF